MKKERIQKIISNYGKYSRREVEQLIKEKKIKVNDQLAEIGDKISIDDKVYINETLMKFTIAHKYYLVNKPKGYISTKIDAQNREVISLVPNSNNRNLFTIGRLDVNTSGLIIVTTDGKLSQLVNNPRSKIKKVYLVWLNKKIPKEKLKEVFKGVYFEEENIVTLPSKVKTISNDDTKSVFKVSIFEGKKNQIKRMFETNTLDLKVINLKRIQIQNLKLDNLEIGSYKQISQQEIYEKLNLIDALKT